MYRANPHGRALTWLALEPGSGKPVGCTSVFPRRVLVDGRARTGSIGGDCFIDPAYRRRGIATALHRASYETMQAHGVEFMYGPPRPNNLAALLKAGSRVLANFRKWVRPLSGRALQAVLHRTPPRSLRRLADFSVGILNKATRGGRRPVALEPVLRFGDEFDRMFESAAADHRVVCVRDSAYLDWRYHGAPGRRQLPFGIRMDGRLVGFLALESSGERAALADLFTAADPAIVDATIEAVIDKLAGDGCSLLGAALMEGSAAEGRLRRFGFLRRDQREFQVLARSDDPQLGTLTTRSAWHFCAADEDMDSVLRPDRDDERETPGPLTRPSATPR